MKKFTEFLNEKLILLGGTRPKNNNVVIMAGGSGSGKGFIQKNLLGIDGKVFDVDSFKTLSLKSPKINALVMEEFGVELKNLNISSEDDVAIMHQIIATLGLHDKTLENFLLSTVTSKNNPNIIFDLTLKSIRKLNSITKAVSEFGYTKENIHVVWVVNKLDTALQQNMERDRRVPKHILIDTHMHVALTFKNIFKNKKVFQRYIDGDLWIVFNDKYVDTLIKSSGYGGSYVSKAVYFKMKEKGKPIIEKKEVEWKFLKKLREYTRTKF